MLNAAKIFSHYGKLRLRCLTYQVGTLITQVKQFLLWLAVFLGPAIMALTFGMLLVVGQLYNSKLSPAHWLLVCWCLLAVQALVVWVCRTAILQPRYALFLHSLPCSPLHHRLADVFLLSCCLPVFWLHMLVVANANFSQWQNVLPQLGFLGLQLVSAIFILYRPKRSVFGLLVTLPAIPYLNEAWLGLSLLSIAIFLFPLLPISPQPLRLNTATMLTLWLKLSSHRPEQWLSRLLLLGLVTMLGAITLVQRPDLALTVHTLCASLLALISGTMQLTNNRLMQDYLLFFQQFAAKNHYWQYLAPAVLWAISLLLLSHLQAATWLLLIATLLFGFMVCLAKVKPQQLIPGWFFSAIVFGGIAYLV